MTSVETFLRRAADDLEPVLDRMIPSENTPPIRLHAACRWSVFAGGKRIRPAVVLAVGETFGADRSVLLEMAAAIELIHTYSLIHDDLPAMDDDGLRRGRATCHVKFGEATAILAGDVLQTLAFRAVANADGLDAETRLRLIALLADAAGTPAGMVSGQMLDLDAEGKNLTIEDISNIHVQKTGALISLAAAAGAVIAGVSSPDLEPLNSYSRSLGLLFQITDDLLDVTQETTTLGKTAGKDAASRKSTYPGLLGIEAAKGLAEQTANDGKQYLAAVPRDTSLLEGLADFVLERSK